MCLLEYFNIQIFLYNYQYASYIQEACYYRNIIEHGNVTLPPRGINCAQMQNLTHRQGSGPGTLIQK